MAEKQRRDAEGDVQYLTDAQLDRIIEQNPGSDIRDYEDLQTGNVTCSANHLFDLLNNWKYWEPSPLVWRPHLWHKLSKFRKKISLHI